MATDFADYANIRILWSPQPVIEDLRSGVPVATDHMVIEAFVKGDGPSPQEMPSIKLHAINLDGYITRYATLASDADWLNAGSSLTWTETGLMPDGFRAEIRCQAIFGDLTVLPTISGLVGSATILKAGGRYGAGGIGAELRGELGDAIQLSFAAPS